VESKYVRIYDNGANSVNGGASLSLFLSLSLYLSIYLSIYLSLSFSRNRVNESRPSNCSDVYRYYSGTWWFTTRRTTRVQPSEVKSPSIYVQNLHRSLSSVRQRNYIPK